MMRTFVVTLALILLMPSASAVPFSPNSKGAALSNKNHRHLALYDDDHKKKPVVIRGGAIFDKPLANSQKFLTLSSVVATSCGLCMWLLSWDQVGDFVAPMLKGVDSPPPIIKTLWAASLIGWGVGKFVAAQSGAEATKKFCQINVFAMALNLSGIIPTRSAPDIVINGSLFLGYLYFGYLS